MQRNNIRRTKYSCQKTYFHLHLLGYILDNDILDIAWNFWPDFRQGLLLCSSNVNFLYIMTSRSLLRITTFNNWTINVNGSRLIGRQVKRHLVALALKLLYLNKKIFVNCQLQFFKIYHSMGHTRKEQPNSLTNVPGLSADWTDFLLCYFVIILALFSSVIVWNENEKLTPFICFLIAMTLGWFWNLLIAFSVGLWEMYKALTKSSLVLIPKFETIFTKNHLKYLWHKFHLLQTYHSHLE